MIKFIGVYAAVVSTVLSYIVLFIYRIIDINKKYLKVTFNKELAIDFFIINIAICIAYLNYNIYIEFVMLFIYIVIISIFIKKNLHKMISLIKKEN